MGFFMKLKSFFTGRRPLDDTLYEELEDVLIQSDIGYEMTGRIIKALEKEVKARGVADTEGVYGTLRDILSGFLIRENLEIPLTEGELNVILVTGVNGVGKTTTIGKLAARYAAQGKRVVLGAADTFRAAAVEQLEEWAKRAGADFVKGKAGDDPGAVCYDTLDYALRKGFDIAIIDTAGRLHNKNNLMKELEKINGVIKKKLGGRPYESLLVIDGTTGQNAIAQARTFNEATDLTGFVITKLDGASKGGVVFSVSDLTGKPVKFVGMGEKIDDLRVFDPAEFIAAIFG
ncbi:MAG: signal recognition particle-docking protein FtsY [Fusobacteriaceae bacterium]|jgi:fused signal recognition particle receptor|nr:signal recognition particle-docking protein FtsY [Fusobacteriaceae bacterium]